MRDRLIVTGFGLLDRIPCQLDHCHYQFCELVRYLSFRVQSCLILHRQRGELLMQTGDGWLTGCPGHGGMQMTIWLGQKAASVCDQIDQQITTLYCRNDEMSIDFLDHLDGHQTSAKYSRHAIYTTCATGYGLSTVGYWAYCADVAATASLFCLLFHAGQAAIKLPSAEASKRAQCTSPGQYAPYIKGVMKTP